MVTAAAIVVGVVLLQLHASDTLKEDIETARPQPLSTTRRQSPPSPPSPPPAPQPLLGTKNTPDRIQHSQGGGISRQDEDLLDLMVRIAETPEEWERIHRVLSLIGREKTSYETTENYSKYNKIKHEIEETTNLTENMLKPLHQNRPLYGITSVARIEPKTTPTTMVPLASTHSLVENVEDHDFEPENAKDMDTGWPDFEEAIVKKVKKSHSLAENDVLESNWLEKDWSDSNWNKIISGGKNEHSTSQLSKGLVYSISSTKDKKPSSEYWSEVPRSRLSQDPKILEFRLKDNIVNQNHTVDQNISEETNGSAARSGRPVFVYHRVTTSPQERRGNSAFIAVSVVRQSPGETPSSTTLPPLLQKVPSLSKHEKKRGHWRQEVHRQHNRGRRHHHTHGHAHTPH